MGISVYGGSGAVVEMVVSVWDERTASGQAVNGVLRPDQADALGRALMQAAAQAQPEQEGR